MNNAQTFFTLFYAIYFAVTTTLTGKFQPFDTPLMFKLKLRAWFRFCISFTILNIGPLAYFVVVFKWLGSMKTFTESFLQMLILLILSLAGFGYYRIFYGLMIAKFRNRYVFYEECLPQSVQEELKQRDKSHSDWLAHLVPGIVWVGVSFILAYLWTKPYEI